MTRPSGPYLRGKRIDPTAISGQELVADLVDNAFLAYNAGRLREACHLFTERMLQPDTTVGMSLTGAMTPAGLGMSCLIPLMEAGFVDWIISTGANLYHDAHFALGLALHQGRPNADDVELREKGVVRIYDIFFDYDVLLSTDAFVREVSARPEFQRADEHRRVPLPPRRLPPRARGGARRSPGAPCWPRAHELGVPIYTSSPGDSSIGMNVAEQALAGSLLRFDVSADVNTTAAIVLEAKRTGGKSGVLIGDVSSARGDVFLLYIYWLSSCMLESIAVLGARLRLGDVSVIAELFRIGLEARERSYCVSSALCSIPELRKHLGFRMKHLTVLQ